MRIVSSLRSAGPLLLAFAVWSCSRGAPPASTGDLPGGDLRFAADGPQRHDLGDLSACASNDGGCPLLTPVGDELTACPTGKYWPPTLSVRGDRVAVGCLLDGAQMTTPVVELRDSKWNLVQSLSLNDSDGYYYGDIQLTPFDGRFQIIYQYNCNDMGSWNVGWGWGCIDFREIDDTGATVTPSTVFGQEGHNGHPVLDWSGSGFGVGWVSYDTAYFRSIGANRMLVGARGDNVNLGEDPNKSDSRDSARTKIAWDGAAFGVFVIVGGQMYFSRVDASGNILVGLTAMTNLGAAFSDYFSGQFSVLAAGSGYLLAYQDTAAKQVVVRPVGLDGKAPSTTSVWDGNYAYPQMIEHGGTYYLFSHDDNTQGRVAVLNQQGTVLQKGPIVPGRFMQYPVPAVDPGGDAAAVAYLDANGQVKVQRLQLGPP